ncbi:GT-D fold domain-containing glycosyltransferase [Actinoplanes sp. NPDC051861]|uniref:GT-D fold domain-containing glycosyltransferase n=1 Tax=Actinoplanes sp. NPDC051861 TaxID=3155170 RepID=UPI003445C0D2
MFREVFKPDADKTAEEKRKAAAAKRKADEKREAEDRKILTDIRWELQEQRKYLELFRVMLTKDVITEVTAFTGEHQLTFEDTLQRIIKDRVSFARFGDGEFKTMLRSDFNLKFQPWSPGLASELREVLRFDGFDQERLMLGFPYPYRNLHWSGVWVDIWHEVRPLLRTDMKYGNSHVSRPIFFQQMGQRGADMWRQVWEDQDICIITGENSRFTLTPQLFDNVKSSSYIYSTPVNAYADLPRLMKVLEDEDPDRLYLLSLGPAGTLVSAWLSRMGRWAIDVGHISDSWANVFDGGAWPESLGVHRK